MQFLGDHELKKRETVILVCLRTVNTIRISMYVCMYTQQVVLQVC